MSATFSLPAGGASAGASAMGLGSQPGTLAPASNGPGSWRASLSAGGGGSVAAGAGVPASESPTLAAGSNAAGAWQASLGSEGGGSGGNAAPMPTESAVAPSSTAVAFVRGTTPLYVPSQWHIAKSFHSSGWARDRKPGERAAFVEDWIADEEGRETYRAKLEERLEAIQERWKD